MIYKFLPCLALTLSVFLYGCSPSGTSATDVTAFSPNSCGFISGQVTTSSGGSTGLSNYAINLGSGTISYSNINNTFYKFNNSVGFKIIDVGPTCLSSITAWPGGGSTGAVTATIGHSYIVQFTTTVNGVSTLTYSKLIVNDYTGGVINVSYVPSL